MSRTTRPASVFAPAALLPERPYLRVVASVALRRTDGARLLLIETAPSQIVETTGYEVPAQGAA